ncbi:MAG TPA: hypothetical protein VNQ97_13350, partial [Burkholderiaceae bacterium]|nr:hypothetical protein [Burkholderiaceae bacterium]
MNTNWKLLLAGFVRAIGKGLRFFITRTLPATWRWLRGTAYPVLRRLYLKLPHRHIVTAVVVAAVVGIALLRRVDNDAPEVFAFDASAPIQVPQREARWVDQ